MEITIRRTEPSDVDAFIEMFSKPRVIWGSLQVPYPSVENWRRRLEPQDGFYSLVACVEGKVVGTISLRTFPQNPRRKHAASLGIMVHDDWQGKGVGAALMQAAVDLADNWLNLTRIELEVFTDNAPALRLYKKFGFLIEGTLKQYAYRDAMYVDTYVMARIRT